MKRPADARRLLWRFRWAALAVCLLLYVAWVLLLPPSAPRGMFGRLAVLAIRAAAAGALLRQAQGQGDPGWQRLWRFLGLGVALWALGDASLLALYLWGSDPIALPSIPDLFRLAGFLAAFRALTSHPLKVAERFGRIRDILDNAILTLSVVTLTWLVLVRGALAVGIGSSIQVLWAAAHPALDFILFSLAVHLLLQGGTLRDALAFGAVGLGMSLQGVGDVVWGYLRLQQESMAGTLLEACWIAGTISLLPVAGGLRGWHLPTRISGRLRAAWGAVARRIEPLLSLSFTYAVVGMTVLDWWLFGEVDWVAVVAASALSLLLVARQGAVMGQAELRSAFDQVTSARQELERLNTVLEQRVQERTMALESTVADLERLNQELQELDKLKSEFVALVSHELRAPLTNIRTGIELILGGETGMRTNARESLALVHEESERLSRLVEAILDLSALEAGRISLQPQTLALEDELAKVQGKFPEHLQPDRVRFALPDDLPPIRADERGLSSVLFHLLDNALKYAPQGEIRVEAWRQARSVHVAVTDCGPGIPEEERERVFEMFHRLDGRDSREVYGHGLGLHMARRLMESMGGGIRAEPAPSGGGARFRFWLPIAEASSA